MTLKEIKDRQSEALVHELGHALADQNFPIEKFLGKNSEDSEESLARESVVEGQAEWLLTPSPGRRRRRASRR